MSQAPDLNREPDILGPTGFEPATSLPPAGADFHALLPRNVGARLVNRGGRPFRLRRAHAWASSGALTYLSYDPSKFHSADIRPSTRHIRRPCSRTTCSVRHTDCSRKFLLHRYPFVHHLAACVASFRASHNNNIYMYGVVYILCVGSLSARRLRFTAFTTFTAIGTTKTS